MTRLDTSARLQIRRRGHNHLPLFKNWWSFIVVLACRIEHVKPFCFDSLSLIALLFFSWKASSSSSSSICLFFPEKKTAIAARYYCYYVFVNLLNKARTRTAVGIHQRERVGAGRPLSPAGNWRMLINWSKWRTIFRNRFGSSLENNLALVTAPVYTLTSFIEDLKIQILFCQDQRVRLGY